MKKRVFIVLKEDIMHYPPVLTILRVLSEMGYEVVHIGVYNDPEGRRGFEAEGVRFLPTLDYNGKACPIHKFAEQMKFRRQVRNYLRQEKAGADDVLWLMQSETICLLHDLVPKYDTVLHFFEFAWTDVSWKYRMISPTYNPAATIRAARKIVCCEYNRAQMLKGLFQLDEMPVVLPNKVVVDDEQLKVVPEDIRPLIDKVTAAVSGRKMILYQGIFLDGERKLEEFCRSIGSMPDDYMFIAMGKGSGLFDRLKSEYESERIMFIPFIRPPYHLLVTRLASIGVLSYFPRPGSFARTINPLYCAPNKIFEYAKFGIPMISNDVPALKYAFMEYHCGKIVSYPMTAQKITSGVQEIMADYHSFSTGALNYFNSVDIKYVLSAILD